MGFRNRLIAESRFQRWVSSVPLLRTIARRRTRDLFDLCGGFVYSQILFACVTLGLIEKLRDAPCDVATLALYGDIPEIQMRRLLSAAASLGLLEALDGDRYALGQLGAAMAGNPAIGKMIEHHAMLYADLADPVALLRGPRGETALGRYWAYARNTRPDSVSAADVEDYTDLMAVSQSFIAEDVLDAVDLSHNSCLLDVGGGSGAFIDAVAARYPNIRTMLFDLPPVAASAATRLNAPGRPNPTETFGGDFFSDPLPKGADFVSLVRIVHDHDDEDVARLLANIRRAINPGGILIIAEPMSWEGEGTPITDAYFNFYLLAMGSGRARTFSEIAVLLRSAGFDEITEVKTRRPDLVRVIAAQVDFNGQTVNFA